MSRIVEGRFFGVLAVLLAAIASATTRQIFPGTSCRPTGGNLVTFSPQAEVLSTISMNNYGNDERCRWVVNCPAGYVFVTEALAVHTESCCDRVELLDDEGTEIWSKSGVVNGFSYNTTRQVVYLQFYTDSSIVRGYGFSLSYSCQAPGTLTVPAPPTPAPPSPPVSDVYPGTSCRPTSNNLVTLTPQAEVVTNIGTSNNYGNDERCRWVVSCPAGFVFAVEALAMHTESCCDRVYLMDTDGIVIFTQSGILNGFSYNTTKQTVYVQFRTDSSVVQGYGFSMNFACLTAGTLTAPIPPTPAPVTPVPLFSGRSCRPTGGNLVTFTPDVGEIGNVAVRNNYGNNEQCRWVIACPKNTVFMTLALQVNTESCCDRVELLDDEDNRLWIQSGNVNSYSAASTAQVVNLQFRSDSSIIRGYGFDLYYVCQNRGDDLPQAPTFAPLPAGASALYVWSSILVTAVIGVLCIAL